jgi:small conductance mechanosensitive channel
MLPELYVRLAIAAVLLIFAFAVDRLLRRRLPALLKKAAIGKLLAHKFSSVAIYLLAIAAAAWLIDLVTLFGQLQTALPLAAQLIQVGILWAVAAWAVRIFSDIFVRAKKPLERIGVPHHLNVLLRKTFKWAIYGIAIIWTLGIFGFVGAIQGVLVGAGFAGIVIGFAAKDTLSNLFAGVIILLDRPFVVGEWVNIPAYNIIGCVREISLKSTRIDAVDNTFVTLPNAALATTPIVNYSRNRLRRHIIPVSISYESDFRKAVQVIKKVLKADPAVVKDRPPEVLFSGFGESSVDLTIRVWTDTAKGGGPVETPSRMRNDIKRALDKARIEIPYPRRVIIKKSK